MLHREDTPAIPRGAGYELIDRLREEQQPVVVDHADELTWLSLRNVPTVHLIAADQLNAYDVLCNDWVVFTRATLPATAPSAPDADGGDES